MRKIMTIAAANLRRSLREPVAVFFLFLFPMLLILVFGLAFGGAVEPRVGVVGDRADPLAAAMLDRLGDADGITVRRLDTAGDLVSAVERGDLEAGLVLPTGYGARVRSGERVELRYVARPGQLSNQVQQIVTGAVDQEASRLRAAQFALREGAAPGFDEALARADSVAADMPGFAVTVHTAGTADFPDTLGRFDVGASSQLLLFLFLTALTGSAALIETRRLGVSRRMLATPTTPATIIAGEAAGRLAVAILQGILIMAGSALVFRVDWGDPVAAALLMTSFALVASGAGLLLGATARTPQQSLAVGLLLSLSLAALGGTMMPLDLFPPTMRTVAHLTPHAWAVDGFTELVRHGAGVVDIVPQLGVLLVTAAVLMALSSWRLRRSISG